MTDPLQFKILNLVQPNGDNTKVDEEKIRSICAEGLSECPPEDRCLAWLVLFGIYPSDPTQWKDVRDEIYANYKDFCELFQMQDWHTRHFVPNVQKTKFNLPDNAKMHVIHGDIVRTGRHIFFLPPGDVVEPYESQILAPFAEHMRRLERILYVFASCNPSLSYMQGFNEILPVIYYVNCQAKQIFDDDMFLVEAVTFQCLHEILTATELNVLYTTQDQSSLIMHKLQDFEYILAKHVPEASNILRTLKIEPILYSFRWFNLLFAQEYELPVLLIIWDTLLAHKDHLVEFSFYFGAASILSKQDCLDVNAFPKTLQTLQTLKVSNVFTVIKKANEMYQEDHAPPGIFRRIKRRLSARF